MRAQEKGQDRRITLAYDLSQRVVPYDSNLGGRQLLPQFIIGISQLRLMVLAERASLLMARV